MIEYATLRPGPRFRPLRSAIYYANRLTTRPSLRQAISGSVASAIRLAHPPAALGRSAGDPASQRERLRMLRTDGFVRLGRMLSTRDVADVHAFLVARNAIDYFDHSRSFRTNAIPSDVRMASYSIEDIYACAPLLRFANDPSILEVIGNYLGCKPTLSSIGLRWSFPDRGDGRGIQAFHRDTEDWRFVKLFLYLTDVDETAGPHVYVAGSHRTGGTVFLKHLDDAEVEKEYGVDKIITFTGPAGEAFVADTYGIHKGVAPTARPRLILQVQYSVLPCFAFIYSARQRLAGAKIDHYVNRLFVE